MMFRVNTNCKAAAGVEDLTAASMNSSVVWDVIHVIRQFTAVSEESVTSIFRVEEQAK
jgi:molybdenum cofactor biosynthesis enzyme